MLAIERWAAVDPEGRARLWHRLSRTARRQLRAEAAALEDLRRWSFRGGNAELAARVDGEIVLSGPAGTGKSVAALHRVFELAVRNPGMRALLVRRTHVSLTSSGLVTWREKVCPVSLEKRTVTYYGGSSEEPAQYRFWNGSKVMLGGMDHSGKVMSTEYDLIYVQEAIELDEDHWESLSTRLRNGRLQHMQLIADTNPSAPQHWLKDRANKGTTVMIESRHADNPAYVDDAGEPTPEGRVYLGRLDKLTGVRRLRLRDGVWAAAEGVVYDGWDDARNLVDHFDPPAEWRRWWVIDFGYTNPFVCQWWAEDPDGRYWLYREIYRTQRLVEDHAADILAQVARVTDKGAERGLTLAQAVAAGGPMVEWLEPKPEAIIVDHDAEDRATLRRHLGGMATRAARKEKGPGIEAVAARIRPAGDGKPRLLIMRDTLVERDDLLVDAKLPTCTYEELAGYVWAPPTGGRAPKEEPVKKDDHGVDGMRYLVATNDLAGRPSIRSF